MIKNLYELYNLIEKVSTALPNVNQFVNSFDSLNREDTSYAAVVLQFRDGTQATEGTVRYRFYLGYVDRVNENTDTPSTSNNILTQSIAEENIRLIINKLYPEVDITFGNTFYPFTQRFTALTAGCYVELAITLAVKDCNYESGSVLRDVEIVSDSNGVKEVVPGAGVDGFKKVIVRTEVPLKTEIEKDIVITANGNTTYTPDEGQSFSKVNVDVNVSVSGDSIPGTKDWFNSNNFKWQNSVDYGGHRYYSGDRTGNSYSVPDMGLAYQTYDQSTQLWSEVVDRDGNIIRCDFLPNHTSGNTSEVTAPKIELHKNFINEDFLVLSDSNMYNVDSTYVNQGMELTQTGQYCDEVELKAFEFYSQYSFNISNEEKTLVKGKPVLFNNTMPFTKEYGRNIDWPIQDVVFGSGVAYGFFSIDSPSFSMEARGQNINFPDVLSPSTTVMNAVYITSSQYDLAGSTLLPYITEIKEISNDPQYTCCCFSSLQKLKKIPAKVFNNATYTCGMFDYCVSLESIPEGTKFPAVTNIGSSNQYGGMFFHCDNLKSIPLDIFDGAVIRVAQNAFRNCSSLVTIGKITLNPEENYVDYMFLGCSSLENLGGLTNLKANLSLSSCPKLTHDSLMNVINEAADVTSSPKTLTLGADNLAKLTAEEKAIATNKGWILK